jgi:hypothetical protein
MSSLKYIKYDIYVVTYLNISTQFLVLIFGLTLYSNPNLHLTQAEWNICKYMVTREYIIKFLLDKKLEALKVSRTLCKSHSERIKT